MVQKPLSACCTPTALTLRAGWGQERLRGSAGDGLGLDKAFPGKGLGMESPTFLSPLPELLVLWPAWGWPWGGCWWVLCCLTSAAAPALLECMDLIFNT